MYKQGEYTLSCGPSRYQLPKAGTVVTCKDLFYSHPVRRGVIQRNLPKQLEDCRARLYRLALIHPEIGVTLTDAGSRRQLLRAPPGRSLLSTLSDAFGAPIASALMPVSLTSGQFRMHGYVTPPSVSLPSAELQFFYVNRRFVRRTPLHKAVSKAFASACMASSQTSSVAEEPWDYGSSRGASGRGGGGGRRRPTATGAAAQTGAALNQPHLGHPGYVLCLESPPGEYDVTYDVEKTLIEFRDWERPLDLLCEVLQQAWPRRSPFNPGAEPQPQPQPQPQPRPRPHGAGEGGRGASPITPPLNFALISSEAAAAPSPPSPPRDFGIDAIVVNGSPDEDADEDGDGDEGDRRRKGQFPPPEAEDDGERDECACCPPKTSTSRRHVGRRNGASAAVAVSDEAGGNILCQSIESFGNAPASCSPLISHAAPHASRRLAVCELLATWKNPVFVPHSNHDQPAVLEATPPVAEMSREVLDGAKVVAQWGKKFVLAVSTSGDLFAVDQHAADERVRLEELRGALLAPAQQRSRSASRGEQPSPSPIPTAVLGRPLRCQLTASELATLRANASLAWRWGWRWEDNAGNAAPGETAAGLPPVHSDVQSNTTDAGVSLTGMPIVEGTALGVEALAEYLREIAAIGATSAPPPALHRLLASKACRGAIMFGDELSPTDCAALLGSLRRTLLPLYCAHGRPTAVLLVPGVASDASGAAAAEADAPTVAAFVDDDDDESTPAKRRRMLVRRAKKEWRVIRTMVEQVSHRV